MNAPRIRRVLILLHLYFAAFMAPAFVLMAVSGGLYLIGNKGKVERVELPLPAGSTLDFKSKSIEADVNALFTAAGITQDYEYLKVRSRTIQTRPTSRVHIELSQTADGLTATRNTPNFQASIIELHKGHGPLLFKTYQKIVALALLFVVLGGVIVGLLAQAYRRKTIIASLIGLAAFLCLVLLA